MKSLHDVFMRKKSKLSGSIPYSMDRNLYDIMENGNVSSIIGLSNTEILIYSMYTIY